MGCRNNNNNNSSLKIVIDKLSWHIYRMKSERKNVVRIGIPEVICEIRPKLKKEIC